MQGHLHIDEYRKIFCDLDVVSLHQLQQYLICKKNHNIIVTVCNWQWFRAVPKERSAQNNYLDGNQRIVFNKIGKSCGGEASLVS